MKRVVGTLMLVVGTLSVAPTAAQQAQQTVDYDIFCKLPDTQTKRETFLAVSPDNRAQLVRTQLERWRDANRAKLTEKQLTALAELIAAITPDTYAEGPKGEEARVKARSLSELQFQLFTMDQVQAMQPYAPCIAKIKTPSL